METTETSADGLNHEYQITVSATEISDRISGRLKELQRTAHINGFRPGKVPISILRQRYVKSVMGEVLELVVGETSQQALKDEGVRAALQPKIEIKSFDEDKDLEYVMQVEALPLIETPDLKNLKFNRLVVEVAEEEVETAVSNLAERNRGFSEVKRKRKSKKGEVLVIDFSATVDTKPLENARGEDFNLGLGTDSFLPGFDGALIGSRAGEHHSVPIDLPDNYPDEAVRGKKAVFEVDVKRHLEPDEIKIDDNLATTLGLENLAALKEATKAELERGYKSQSRTRLKREMLDSFAGSYDFEVPGGMVSREFEGIWLQIEKDMEQVGRTWDDEEQTEEEAREEYRGIAVRRVRLALLLSEIGQQNNISVPQEELNQAVMEQARRFPGKEQEVFDYFKNSSDAISGLHAPIFEDKVIDFIIEMSDVSETNATVEELYRNPDVTEPKKLPAPEKTSKKAAKNKKLKTETKRRKSTTPSKSKTKAKKAPES